MKPKKRLRKKKNLDSENEYGTSSSSSEAEELFKDDVASFSDLDEALMGIIEDKRQKIQEETAAVQRLKKAGRRPGKARVSINFIKGLS